MLTHTPEGCMSHVYIMRLLRLLMTRHECVDFSAIIISIAERFPFYPRSYSSGFSKASRTVFID